jgi:hypothetical protein
MRRWTPITVVALVAAFIIGCGGTPTAVPAASDAVTHSAASSEKKTTPVVNKVKADSKPTRAEKYPFSVTVKSDASDLTKVTITVKNVLGHAVGPVAVIFNGGPEGTSGVFPESATTSRGDTLKPNQLGGTDAGFGFASLNAGDTYRVKVKYPGGAPVCVLASARLTDQPDLTPAESYTNCSH